MKKSLLCCFGILGIIIFSSATACSLLSLLGLDPAVATPSEALIWKGHLPSAPNPAEERWSYYNTTDETCYVYEANTWRALAKQVEVPVTVLVWAGQLAEAPASPTKGTAYYNTTNGKTYIWDGESWQSIAADRVETVTINEISWQGHSTAAPSPAQKGYAYFNPSDGKSYLYDGTTWNIIAASTSTTTNTPVATVIWKANTTAPASPQVGWAYFNTADQKSYIWDGSTWNLIATSTTTTTPSTPVATVIWKTNTTAPASPQVGWAYFNTADQKSYIYDGSAWNLIATSTTTEVPVSDILWQGSGASNPASPQKGWAYYNTGSGTSFLYDGATWQTIAVDRTVNVPVTDITWKGSSVGAPTGTPAEGWAYYDTGDGKSYIYVDGTGWIMIAQAQTVLSNDVKWKGSFATAPSNPLVGDIYYNSTDNQTCLYTGSAWEAIAQDAGSSLNVANISVAPGSFLTLSHGLNRSDLTFNAQFVKEGIVRNYDEYTRLYGIEAFSATQSSFYTTDVSGVVAQKLKTSPYNIVVAYRDASIGKFKIYSTAGALVRNEQTFITNTSFISMDTLPNGDFVIVYSDESSTPSGRCFFDVWSGDGKTRKVANQSVTDYDTNRLEVTALADSSFALLFRVEVNGMDMGMKIYGPTGSMIKDLTYVSVSDNYTSSSITTLAPSLISSGDIGVLTENRTGGYMLYGATYSPLGMPRGTFTQITDCDSVWTKNTWANGATNLEVSVDTTTKVEDTGSLKLLIPSDFGNDQTLAYFNLPYPFTVRSNYSNWSFKIRSNAPIPADGIRIRGWQNSWAVRTSDTQPDGGTYHDFRTPYIPANTWVDVDFSFRTDPASTLSLPINSLSVRLNFDNLADQTVWIDDIRQAPLNKLTSYHFHQYKDTEDTHGKFLLPLSGGLVMTLYRQNSSDFLYVRILNADMTASLSETLINPYETHNKVGSALLSDGTIAVTYYDSARLETALVILDSQGRIIKPHTRLSDYRYDYQNLLPLDNGRFALFAQNDTQDFGVFHLTCNARLELVEVGVNEARLYNYTPETLELRLSVNQ